MFRRSEVVGHSAKLNAANHRSSYAPESDVTVDYPPIWLGIIRRVSAIRAPARAAR